MAVPMDAHWAVYWAWMMALRWAELMGAAKAASLAQHLAVRTEEKTAGQMGAWWVESTEYCSAVH